jgi:hypothetical protein
MAEKVSALRMPPSVILAQKVIDDRVEGEVSTDRDAHAGRGPCWTVLIARGAEGRRGSGGAGTATFRGTGGGPAGYPGLA